MSAVCSRIPCLFLCLSFQLHCRTAELELGPWFERISLCAEGVMGMGMGMGPNTDATDSRDSRKRLRAPDPSNDSVASCQIYFNFLFAAMARRAC